MRPKFEVSWILNRRDSTGSRAPVLDVVRVGEREWISEVSMPTAAEGGRQSKAMHTQEHVQTQHRVEIAQVHHSS